jgi:hypothetical protein
MHLSGVPNDAGLMVRVGEPELLVWFVPMPVRVRVFGVTIAVFRGNWRKGLAKLASGNNA